MKKTIRLLVFSGALAMLACPVFADNSPDPGSGPGGTNPPPPPTNSTSSTSSSTSGLGSIVSEIISIAGVVGL